MESDIEKLAISVIELNVGGQLYTTSLATLLKVSGSVLSEMFSPERKGKLLTDSRGRCFIDRDGFLFRFILDYLRNLRLVLPDNFAEKERLKHEAEFFKLPGLMASISAGIATISEIPKNSKDTQKGDLVPGCISVGYRGTFAFGRDGLADVKFRKLNRILVHGKVSLCREVFWDTLNESRDPDRGGNDRYTARFFLKHSFLEQAFDSLYNKKFRLVSSCASSAGALQNQSNNTAAALPTSGVDSDESRWYHYNEFIFVRP